MIVRLDAGNGGARLELDGQVHSRARAAHHARARAAAAGRFAALVSLGEEESTIAGLRRRRILMDSPRVLARDDREGRAQAGGRSQPPSADSSSDASASSVRSEPRAPIS